MGKRNVKKRVTLVERLAVFPLQVGRDVTGSAVAELETVVWGNRLWQPAFVSPFRPSEIRNEVLTTFRK